MAYEKQNFQQGQILTAEAMNKIEEELARKKSWDELGDKPFYSEYKDAVLFPETTIEFSSDNEIFNFEISLINGQEYTVVWDGKEYKETAFPSKYYGQTFIVVGNASLFGGGDNTGEPFAIGSLVGQGLAGAFTSTPGVTSKAEIKYVEETVRPLDKKYLDLDWMPGEVEADLSIIVPEKNFVSAGSGYDLENVFFDVVAKYSKMKVVYDGVTYECDVRHYPNICYAGNGALRDTALTYPDTGEDFCVFFTNTWSAVYTRDNGVSHTISVSGLEQYVHLPARYNGGTPTGILIKDSKNYDIYRITTENGELKITMVASGN